MRCLINDMDIFFYLIFAPIVIGLLATILAWKTIKHRWLYLVASILLILGLQSLISSVTFAVIAYFWSLDTSTHTINFASLRNLSISTILQFVIGCPILWRLYKVFKII